MNELKQPKIVCLCGSTRFRKEIEEENRRQTMRGNIVLAPGVFAHSGDFITEDEKERLDQLHLRKIDMADWIIIVCPGNYIGESTRKEIAYAETHEKSILCFHGHAEKRKQTTPAPELFEALEDMVNEFWGTEASNETMRVLTQARAALAKAKRK